MRGKDFETQAARWPHGITPACAGKSRRRCSLSWKMEGSPPRVRGKEFTTASSTIVLWDHPRVCGEKAVLPMWTNTRLGSPPRVRGKAFSYSARSRAVGITPACAGKRPPDFPSRPPAGDHPRVCGEKAFNERRWDLVLGSPPRVRGKVGSGVDLGPHLGITPACAGKSPPWTNDQVLRKDHPRVCGEKSCW